MKKTAEEAAGLEKDLYNSGDNIQVTLFENDEINDDSALRPIHYLGSKLRLLEVIKGVIDEVDNTQGVVCDLFAGSGTVSKYLSADRTVISCDIQEYSRVLCSALLNPIKSKYTNSQFIEMCKMSSHRNHLKLCFSELEEYEEDCIKTGELGDLEPICDLIENGSIVSYELGYKDNVLGKLKQIMDTVILRIKEFNFHVGPEALTTRYFGGLYFSYKQSVDIDSILEQIFNLDKTYTDTYLAALLSTVSDIVNTVGKQFAQPIKSKNSDGTPKKNILKKVQKDRSLDVFEYYDKWLSVYLDQEITDKKHLIYKSDYVDVLDKLDRSVKVVYADPPYTRYHYSRYYHVLETICLRDNPNISINFANGEKKISRGVYREDRHQSPFSIKTQAYNAFRTMFEKVSRINAAIILSYSPFDNSKENTPRMLSINQIEELASQYFSDVEVVSVGQFSHSKLNNNDRNFDTNYNAELLIVCKNSIKDGVNK